ncbi:MAG: hypothetical protein AAF679_13440, partial [Pseudomonadota bacterium]
VQLRSGVEFKVPGESLFLKGLQKPAEGADLPPPGCPGNPFQARGIFFSALYDRMQAYRDPNLPPLVPSSMTIWGHESPVFLHKAKVEMFDEVKPRLACSVYHGALEFCRCKADADNLGFCLPSQLCTGGVLITALADSGGSFKALPGTYVEVDGLPYAGSCQSAYQPGGPVACEVRGKIQDGLTVTYKFDLRNTPPGQMLALDRAIRASVLDYVVGKN